MMGEEDSDRSEELRREGIVPPMLDYRTAGADPGISIPQVFAGVFLTTLILMAAVFFGILGSLAVESDWVAIVMIGAAIIGVGAWALSLRRKQYYRGLAIGLWIGFGITFLIEGICFGRIRL
jgi:hypothetical protein